MSHCKQPPSGVINNARVFVNNNEHQCGCLRGNVRLPKESVADPGVPSTQYLPSFLIVEHFMFTQVVVCLIQGYESWRVGTNVTFLSLTLPECLAGRSDTNQVNGT